MQQPRINTRRLLLRPFSLPDASVVQTLAGDIQVADTTHNIPHPYEDGMAEEWISGHLPAFKAGTQVTLAITLVESGELAGAVGLTMLQYKREAELGYWVGVPFWNRGIATEAVVAIIDYGFSQMKLGRITGWHLLRNPSSGRVMEKAGLRSDPDSQRTLVKNGREELLTSRSIRFEGWSKRFEPSIRPMYDL